MLASTSLIAASLVAASLVPALIAPTTIETWQWFISGALATLVIYQEVRIFRIRRKSAKREELFQIVTENAADMIALVDVKGHRLYNSPAYKRILGYSAAELGETSAFDQIHPEDRFRVLQAAREARNTGIGKKLEYRIRHRDGTWRCLESIAGTIRDEKGEVAKLVIVNRDITERKRAEQQAEHNSFHDGLTGLPNRRLFLDRLQRLFEHSQRQPDSAYALLFVDLDGFKSVNDTLGPAVGDQVIVEVGRRLAACLRQENDGDPVQDAMILKNAVLSRMAGDEFSVLLEGVSDPSAAMRVANRILAALGEPLELGGQPWRASASIGIAMSNPAHLRPEDSLQDADAAMRRAKALGGSRCEVSDEDLHTRALNRLKLESELRQAVDLLQFRVLYQPIVHLETRQIAGFEALLRWQHPEQGLISPDKFMDAAEDTGLLLSAGRWLILQVCRQLRAWQVGHQAVTISLNLSARQFADARFLLELQSAIRESAVDPSRLQLEMTEAVAAADPKRSQALLAELQKIGIGVMLDDFGAETSSLSVLRRFPLDGLKIDRSLIAEMLADRGVGDTVDLIIVLGHKLKLKVVASGIETTQQLERLRELRCDLGQGYFFSQPLEAGAAGNLLHDSSPLLQAKVARV
jgi:diguanylate cyclase (GGDEF)-like protein/PAS domain S-box-containing protein